VLVHHGGTHAVMAHAVHQVPQARAARGGQRVAGMAKIMKNAAPERRWQRPRRTS
jgi:hypothetical protein